MSKNESFLAKNDDSPAFDRRLRFVDLDPVNASIIYDGFLNALEQENILGFETIIYKAYKLFNKFPRLKKHYQGVYKYVCIDEFQDTNIAQYKLITEIFPNSEFQNMFAAADDDQIIYFIFQDFIER